MAAYVPLTDLELDDYDLELASLQSEAGSAANYEMERRLLREVAWLRSNVLKLLNQFGAKGECAGCHEEMYWMPRPGKRPIPYMKLGLVHFGNCPDAAQFRRGGEA